MYRMTTTTTTTITRITSTTTIIAPAAAAAPPDDGEVGGSVENGKCQCIDCQHLLLTTVYVHCIINSLHVTLFLYCWSFRLIIFDHRVARHSYTVYSPLYKEKNWTIAVYN